MALPVNSEISILLVGCGKMGLSMLRSWLELPFLKSICIIDPSQPPQDILTDKRILYFSDIPHHPSERFDLIVVAIKPQNFDEVCSKLALINLSKSPVLSIVAGKNIDSYKSIFGQDCPIIRTMPNTPASIGKGMTVAVTSKDVSTSQKTLALSLMSVTGRFVWLEDEFLMDAVTALSGSGPAYVFLLIEILARAGEHLGLTKDFSMLLARQTIIGSAALAEKNADTAVDILRKNVTSPGGTTEAALAVLQQQNALQLLFDQALEAAVKRGQELGQL